MRFLISSAILTVPTSTDWIVAVAVAELNCPKEYQPKQFLLAIGSPALPDRVWISMKASTKSVPMRRSTVPPERCSLSDTDLRCSYSSTAAC